MNYIDIAALLKWYLPERGSHTFGAWIAAQDVARRQRNREISSDDARRALDAFLSDLDDGLFVMYPLDDPHLAEAEALLDSMPDVPLRTLDALHLACARVEHTRVFATADLKLAAAARLLGMQTPTFD